MRVKYIVFKNDQAIIFGEDWAHSDFTRFMEPASAGFVSINGSERTATCYGESVSLKLKSDTERDSRIVTRILFPEL